MDRPTVEQTLLATLPPILKCVVKALGVSRAIDFLSQNGGIRVYIPRTHTRTLGLDEEELRRLRDALGSHVDATGNITLPTARKLATHARDEAIRREREEYSCNEMARRYGLTSRQINNICRAPE